MANQDVFYRIDPAYYQAVKNTVLRKLTESEKCAGALAPRPANETRPPRSSNSLSDYWRRFASLVRPMRARSMRRVKTPETSIYLTICDAVRSLPKDQTPAAMQVYCDPDLTAPLCPTKFFSLVSTALSDLALAAPDPSKSIIHIKAQTGGAKLKIDVLNKHCPGDHCNKASSSRLIDQLTATRRACFSRLHRLVKKMDGTFKFIVAPDTHAHVQFTF